MAKNRGGSKSRSSGTERRVHSWAGYIAALVSASASFALVGAPPFVIPSIGRAVVAGCAAGLFATTRRDALPLAGLAVAGVAIPALFLQPWAQRMGHAEVDTVVALGAVLVAALSAAALALIRARFGELPSVVAAMVLLALVMAMSVGILPGPLTPDRVARRAELATEPIAEQYGFDGQIYMKASLLVEQGADYYDAIVRAIAEDARLAGPPTSLLNVRQPWMTYVWRALPGQPGAKVWDWFALMSVATVVCTGWGMRRLVGDGAAFTAASAVAGYLTYGALSPWFPALSEYWAGCAALCAVMAMLRDRPYLAATLVTAAVAFREIAAWVMVAYAIWWLFSTRRREWWPAMGLAMLGPTALYVAHWAMSPIHGQPTGGLGIWLNATVQSTLAAVGFSGGLVLGATVLYPALAVTAVVGSAMLRDSAKRYGSLAACLAPLVLLGVASSGEWGFYWGAVGMPTVLALAALVYGPFTGLPGAFGSPWTGARAA